MMDVKGAQGLAEKVAGWFADGAAFERPNLAREWIGKGNREYHTMPVLALRESTQKVGVARKHRGQLQLTAAGRTLVPDPAGLWRHLAAKTRRRDAERDAAFCCSRSA